MSITLEGATALDGAIGARSQVLSNTGIGRRTFSRIPTVLEMPNLVELQLTSFHWFQDEGLAELLAEISPIVDYNQKLELRLLDHWFDEPRADETTCRERDMTYAAPLRLRVQLVIKETGEVKEADVFLGDFPIMTPEGTFLINGAERVVVSQLVRSPGVYFDLAEDAATGRKLGSAKLIPSRGAWLEFETSNRGVLSVKVDRKRKLPATVLLRAIGYGTNEEIHALFADLPGEGPDEEGLIAATLARDTSSSIEEAQVELYRRLRPGDPPTKDNAANLLNGLFFQPRRYDLAKVGRYKLNKRLGLSTGLDQRVLSPEDLVAIVRELIRVDRGQRQPDDIDHLGNRRVRAVGELIQMHVRTGLQRLERGIRERMTIQDIETVTPNGLISTTRPVMAAVREFFGGSQLSQFMDQTNPLSELTHKRRLSALGPGGLGRDRAGFDVRDVHHSHYGRICPIETQDGPNIGLVLSLTTYARLNQYGFVETPYRRVFHELDPASQRDMLVGRTLRSEVVGSNGSGPLAAAGTLVDEELATKLADSGISSVVIVPFVSEEISYLTADQESTFNIAQANAPLSERLEFEGARVAARRGDQFVDEPPERIDYMDVSPKQVFSVSASLIPFLEHDDAARALIGANQQRQAVPLLRPQAPMVGTGVEYLAARDSGQVVVAGAPGVVSAVTARYIVVDQDDGTQRRYQLQKFLRSNQDTCINQRPIVHTGDRVNKQDIIADSSSTQKGELALGQNVLAAFMCWEGGNFEDAILISERLVRDYVYTSIHIEKYETEARDTRLGPEEITRDIPNVGEDSLANLDEHGIIRIGAEVHPNDIIVGKVTPRGETELSAEERLLRAIFGEKAREVKDTSLRVPHGVHGKVIDVKRFRREDAGEHELPAGVNEMVRVAIAQKRKISEGDKLANRHGNKGVISRILPAEDMPYLPDGTPIDIVLSPIGVP